MKLIKWKKQPAILGLPASRREWWDLGSGYEVSIHIGAESCSLGVHFAKESLTYDVAKYLGIDTTPEKIVFASKADGRELYLSAGIDCVVLNYTKREHKKELLKKIEIIINKHFKYK